MRLDHLLSKETIKLEIKLWTPVSQSSFVSERALFNFEDAREKRRTAYPENYGGVAQLGEHLLCKQGVRSSILLISTIKIGRIAQVVRAHA